MDSICNSLKKVNFDIPSNVKVKTNGKPAISIFILPDCYNAGMLETLCLQSINNDPIMNCIDDFFRCMETQNIALPNNIYKAKIGAYLASRKKPNLRLGEAAKKGYFDWDNPVFDDLKNFLLRSCT